MGYGWEVSKPDCLKTHSGAIAESITMDAKTGKFSLTGLKIDKDRPLILRMTALVDVKVPPAEGEKDEATTERRRYKSDAIPLVLEGSTWPTDSKMDRTSLLLPSMCLTVFVQAKLFHIIPSFSVTGKALTVTIDGLDEKGDMTIRPGEDANLKAIVKGEC